MRTCFAYNGAYAPGLCLGNRAHQVFKQKEGPKEMGATNRAPTPTYLNPGTVCQFMLLYVKKKNISGCTSVTLEIFGSTLTQT
jgi:hypothetical protein